jgi:hypothetical protein
MASKSKTKGKGFEREVAKYLSDLYNDSFTRVPHSGAFTGGKNSVRKETLTEGQIRAYKGDVIPPDSWKKFNCECKNYAEFPFHQLLTQGKIGLLESWMKQTLEAADPGDISIIFMKFNRKGRYIAYKLTTGFENHRYIDYQDEQGNFWRITGFEDFFELNKDNFMNSCKGIHHG